MTPARITEPAVGACGVGVGQPGVQREQRHLHREGDREREEDPAGRAPVERVGAGRGVARRAGTRRSRPGRSRARGCRERLDRAPWPRLDVVDLSASSSNGSPRSAGIRPRRRPERLLGDLGDRASLRLRLEPATSFARDVCTPSWCRNARHTMPTSMNAEPNIVKRKNFERGVDPLAVAPPADEEVHRHEHDLEHHEEQEEVERAEHADAPGLQDEQPGVVRLRVVVRRDAGDGEREQQARSARRGTARCRRRRRATRCRTSSIQVRSADELEAGVVAVEARRASRG